MDYLALRTHTEMGIKNVISLLVIVICYPLVTVTFWKVLVTV
jgi:hypothetical protein